MDAAHSAEGGGYEIVEDRGKASAVNLKVK
jgi:hypothetical protein